MVELIVGHRYRFTRAYYRPQDYLNVPDLCNYWTTVEWRLVASISGLNSVELLTLGEGTYGNDCGYKIGYIASIGQPSSPDQIIDLTEENFNRLINIPSRFEDLE